MFKKESPNGKWARVSVFCSHYSSGVRHCRAGLGEAVDEGCCVCQHGEERARTNLSAVAAQIFLSAGGTKASLTGGE